ncbi:MAG TPA: hypothetical protein PK653_00560 [Syntrophales bacterium]|nr:hypothetical protein [Syntrophales bacterium]
MEKQGANHLPDIQMKRMKRMLPVTLTKQEVHDKGKQLSRKLSEMRALENHRKEVLAQFNSQAKAIEAEIELLSRAVETGEEMRDVPVMVEYNWAIGQKVITREDDGSVVATETITDADRQTSML